MTYRVPYIDYPRQYEKVRGEMLAAIDRVLRRGDLMLRGDLLAFERRLAEFVGAKYAIGTGNCTDALTLVLRAAGIGPGDEVVTVSHTFVATAAAIRQSGAAPVFADIGPDHLMDPAAVEAVITPRTRCILPVHLNGRLCEMEPLQVIARRRGLRIIEDAAQALGARLEGESAGTFGLAGCFSFYPAKILGAYGDGGAIVTNDEGLAQTVRALRNLGRLPNGELLGWGSNSRLDNLQAAILDHKLDLLPGWIERRREIAARYHAALANLPGLLTPPPPLVRGSRFDVFQNYEIEAAGRDALRAHLSEAGVETMLPWGGRAVHQYPELGFQGLDLPATERLFQRVLLLPMHCELTNEQVDYVAGQIASFTETKTKTKTTRAG
jgi:dTDP-3-amino-2,3,6-trideoxy-4-keto-D-glucose/dTDP-3-amino-3,4,6-trideoxy-alpha-D-glucose/dTDP-2,6-dideoxy-D-kanosamine transaminase